MYYISILLYLCWFERPVSKTTSCVSGRTWNLWIPSWETLSVVGVVGVLVADATNFKGPKVPNFMEKPPFLLFQNKVGCLPCPYKKFKRKTSSQFWDIQQNIFDPVCPIVKFRKMHPNKRSCVIVLDTPSHHGIPSWEPLWVPGHLDELVLVILWTFEIAGVLIVSFTEVFWAGSFWGYT